MCRRFARRRHTIMAGNTGITDSTVIKYRSRPVIAAMTHITGLRSGQVASILSGRNHTVMTSLTNTIDFSMIHRGNRRPASIVMTGLANITDINVGRVFPCCHNTIVTTGTNAIDLAVVYNNQ